MCPDMVEAKSKTRLSLHLLCPFYGHRAGTGACRRSRHRCDLKTVRMLKILGLDFPQKVDIGVKHRNPQLQEQIYSQDQFTTGEQKY